MAELSGKEENDLPDSCFAYIEPGGKKVDGKTEPRSKRHLPYKHADGTPDLAHVRNALARLDQCKAEGLDAEKKASIRKHLEGILAHAKASKENSLTTVLDLLAFLSMSGVQNSAAGAVAADAPAEGWYQVDLAGRWNGHPAGEYKLTPADIRSIVSYFNSACQANGVDLPVDYEHQGVIAKLLGKSAESAGWINGLEARNGDAELWAHIKWVDDALALIRAKKFRYLSSHLMKGYPDPVSGKLIPWVLDSVALTNRPFKKSLPAVANSDAAAAGLDEAAAELPNSAVADQEEGAMEKLLALLAAAMTLDAKTVANSLGVPEDAAANVVLKAIAGRLSAGDQTSKRLKVFANALGVAETADEAAITAAISAKVKPAASDADVKLLAVCNSLGVTPDKSVAVILALLGSTRADPKRIEAERMIENAISLEHRITPANRDGFLAMALKDLEGTRKIIAAMPPLLSAVTNSAAAAAAAETPVLSQADKWACEQAGLKPADFLSTKKRLSEKAA